MVSSSSFPPFLVLVWVGRRYDHQASSVLFFLCKFVFFFLLRELPSLNYFRCREKLGGFFFMFLHLLIIILVLVLQPSCRKKTCWTTLGIKSSLASFFLFLFIIFFVLLCLVIGKTPRATFGVENNWVVFLHVTIFLLFFLLCFYIFFSLEGNLSSTTYKSMTISPKWL
jgi:hypothetical protein